MSKRAQLISLSLLWTCLSGFASTDGLAGEPLPIIPGAAGFGMYTPAGSGRHVQDASLEPGWDDALVGHWDFDGGTPHGAELAGDAAFVKRDKGQALRLNGKGALKLANDAGYLKPDGSFTVMAWVKLKEPGGFVAASEVEGKGYWRLGHNPGQGGKWMFWLGNPAGERIHASYRHTHLGRWRHVAAVYDSNTGKCRLYLNGMRVHDAWNRTIEDLAAARSGRLTIGSGVTGMVDDVMLFDRTLTEQQIGALHASRYSSYFGSRGTTVYKVTNLNDSGPGSLRAALEAEGPRVVVFEVSGTIALKRRIALQPHNSYLTIAGATAPSPGIVIKDHGLRVNDGCHDVLIQHLRIRTGDTSIVGRLPEGWTDVDAAGSGTVFSHPLQVEPQKHYGGGSKRSVWWNGKNLAEAPGKTTQVGLNKWDWDSGTKNSKAKRSAAGVLYVNVGEDPAGGKLEYGFDKSAVADPLTITPGVRDVVIDHLSCTWGGDMNMQSQGCHITIQNCLIAEALHHPRHPKGGHSRGLLVFAYSRDQARYVSVVGNLFAYNMARNPTVAKGHMVLVANNLTSDVNVGIKCFTSDSQSYQDTHLLLSVQKNVVRRANYPMLARLVTGTPEQSEIYFSPDNMVNGKTFSSVADIWEQAVTNPFKSGDVPGMCRVETSPVTVPGLKLKPVDEVEPWVLANAGARPADRDPVDQRIIRNVKTGEGKLPITSQEDVGGWPQLEENRRKLTVPENPSGDADGDGYTNLEEWLHRFAADVEGGTD